MPKPASFRRLIALAACIVVISVVVRYPQTIFASNRSKSAQDSFHLCVSGDQLDLASLPPPPPLDSPELEDENEEEDAQRLQPHHYDPNGLLVVNPNGPHPIYELIKRAEASWNSKLDRASKTLEQAVAEYKKRYHRPPPKGFDIWWDYIVKHKVQLPDEYNQIYKDLEPYWGIDPHDLASILSHLEEDEGVIVVGKRPNNDYITVFNSTLPPDDQGLLVVMMKDLLDVIQGVQQRLPSFRAVLSPHDNPNMLSDYTVKSMALKAAAARTFINISNLPHTETEGWIHACSPSSPAHHTPLSLTSPPPPSPIKCFIHNHLLSMDPCLHLYHLTSHSQFLSHDAGPFPQNLPIPRFSRCSTLLHHDIHPALADNWMDDILPRSNNPEWEDKVDKRLLWRGSNTGIFHGPETHWWHAHRARLVRWAHDLAGFTSLLPSPASPTERVGEPVERRKAYLNPALLDIEFAGEPIGCDPEVCPVLDEEFDWRRRQNMKESGRYRYVLDVDGNGWSSRFKRLITSNSLIFKSTVYPEWFTERIEPWVHYIPIQLDLSDLYDALVFFRGDPTGAGAHEDLA
ncbi:glycosyltransferase family 90 protein [Serpula lacrymans var. lacrymans S7.9]|uniref:Glycosyltransferase family 90 protein n=1 Tax=Serpula lacrymans var. lacrymans (strain S7.9) TaxID=578457 RepID=F8PAF5_SERL9|nr:glycosyltransferase family 90 protein [Serpula lacrymans var. lacrymans S7.9]EGO19794.1 glycosyltransferase family 90 protein [Serpula lacrymans var. lacrymans S7.9]